MNPANQLQTADAAEIASEIREFIKSKQENGDKEDTRALLTEMAGFRWAVSDFLAPV